MRVVMVVLLVFVATITSAAPTRRECRVACRDERAACTTVRCRRDWMRLCHQHGPGACRVTPPTSTLPFPPDSTTTTTSTVRTTTTTLLCNYVTGEVPRSCDDRTLDPEPWYLDGLTPLQFGQVGAYAAAAEVRRGLGFVAFDFF